MRFCPSCGAPLASPAPVTCGRCGTVHHRNAKPCAGVLATRDGRLLLLLRTIDPWSGHWDIPGGFCEVDEHPADAARREAKEEAGLDVEITGFLGIWLDRYPDPVETTSVTLNCYYHATVPPGAEGRPDPAEASELAWFGPDDLPERIAFPGHALDVLAAWRQAMAEGATVTRMPDRPA